jgi:oligopeptide transport system permease protein
MTDTLIELEEFERVGKDTEQGEMVSRPSINYWQDAGRRLRNNRIAMIAVLFISLYALMAIFGPMLVPYDYNTTNLTMYNLRMSGEHWFGTDALGRDLWARVWVGARVSLMIGLMAALIQTTIGVCIGGLSGYLGGNFDLFLMRVIDILNAVPFLIFVILIMMIFGSGVIPIIMAFAITGWIQMARVVRGQVLQLKEQDFIIAAKALGASPLRLIFKHLIPNMAGVIIVTLTFRIPHAIFTEAFLSYIGIGVKPPMTSWGQLAKLGAQSMRVHPYQLLIPAFFISTMMLALQIFGDGLRDALDPTQRR